METRIKQLRKELKLSQEEFGKKIGITKSAISQVEKGVRNLSRPARLAILREFRVNPTWLDEGKGPMFIELDTSQELITFLASVMRADESDPRRTAMAILSKLNPTQWEHFADILESLATK